MSIPPYRHKFYIKRMWDDEKLKIVGRDPKFAPLARSENRIVAFVTSIEKIRLLNVMTGMGEAYLWELATILLCERFNQLLAESGVEERIDMAKLDTLSHYNLNGIIRTREWTSAIGKGKTNAQRKAESRARRGLGNGGDDVGAGQAPGDEGSPGEGPRKARGRRRIRFEVQERDPVPHREVDRGGSGGEEASGSPGADGSGGGDAGQVPAPW